jgi:hypothetical protein
VTSVDREGYLRAMGITAQREKNRAEREARFFRRMSLRRYQCGLRVEHCGGACCRYRGHEPPCLCAGDEGLPGACPA